MSHNLENNKLLAAVLVAGIVAMLAGFVAKNLVHPHDLEKAVLEIDTSALEAASSGGAAPAGPEPILALLAKADPKRGEALAKACLACHDFSKGGPNKIGPNLYGIVNNKKAHKDDFAYSDTIKEMGAKGDHWTYANLGAFLWKPSAYAKGTKMAFPGLKKAQDRADVIAYLRTVADGAAPLPTEAEIAAEAPPTAKDIGAAVPAAKTDAKADGKTAKAAPATVPVADLKVTDKPADKPAADKPANSGNHSAEPVAAQTQKHGDNDSVKPVDPAADSNVTPQGGTITPQN